MKTILAATLLIIATSPLANATQEITCGDIVFSVPAKVGDLPSMDFECPVQVKFFSFRDRNLLLIANDEQDTSRVRVVISAQLNKTAEAYVGQIIRDEGGHELQLTNGPVACSVK